MQYVPQEIVEAYLEQKLILTQQSPEQKLERMNSSSLLTDIITESEINLITTATDQATEGQEKRLMYHLFAR